MQWNDSGLPQRGITHDVGEENHLRCSDIVQFERLAKGIRDHDEQKRGK